MTYVQYEQSYDKHFDGYSNMNRGVIEGSFNGQDFTGVQYPSPAGRTFRDQIPGIEEVVRFRNLGNSVIKSEDKVFNENNLVYADETFFNVFSIPLIMGDPDNVLENKNTLAMSASTAKKYFGDEDPIGKRLKMDDRLDFEVRGVYEDIPNNTQFHFDMILSFKTNEYGYNNQEWLSQNYETYFVLIENASFQQVKNQINDIAIVKMGVELKQYLDMTFEQFEATGNAFNYFLQPLEDVHLKSDNYGGFEPEADITYVYIFTAIAAFILILACINFMNLSTARSANRAKEVGLRKVMGSYRHQIIS